LAVYYTLGLKLFGLDLALPIGVFTGLAVSYPIWLRAGVVVGRIGRHAAVFG